MRGFFRSIWEAVFGKPKKPAVRIKPPPQPALGLVLHRLNPLERAWAKSMHVPWVRFTVYGHSWHDAMYRGQTFDCITAARNMGLDVLLVVHSSPTLKDSLDLCVALHRLFPQCPIQPWNEPDSPTGPGNGWEHFQGDPQRFWQHLIELRAALPLAYLVGPGLASSGEELDRWVKMLHLSPVDAIAVHCYGWPLAGSFRDRYAQARRHTTRPLWCTEFGMEQAVLPPWWAGDWEAEQMENLEDCALQNPWDRAYVFDLWNGSQYGHSIVRADNTERPAARWLREWNGLRL